MLPVVVITGHSNKEAEGSKILSWGSRWQVRGMFRISNSRMMVKISSEVRYSGRVLRVDEGGAGIGKEVKMLRRQDSWNVR